MPGKASVNKGTALCSAILIFIIIAGIAMRWGAIRRDASQGPWGDEWQYEAIGHNIIEGHGYTLFGRQTALRVPVTSLMVAAIYATGKHDLLRARHIWSVMDALTCLLIFCLALLIGGSRLSGLLAAAVYAFDPYFAFIGSHVMSESPFTVLFLASLVTFIAYWRTKSWWWLCASGITLGLSMLARPTSFLYPVVTACLLFLWARRHGRTWFAQTVVYVLMALIVVAPWAIRNQRVFGEFVPLSTFSGATLWCGSGAGPHGDLVIGPWCDKRLWDTASSMSEPEADRYIRDDALATMRRHPGHWLRLGVIKFLRVWFRITKPGWLSAMGLLLALVNLSILVLTWLQVRRSRHVLLRQSVIAVFAYFTFVHVVTYGELRYSIPVYAYYLPFATTALVDLLVSRVPALGRHS